MLSTDGTTAIIQQFIKEEIQSLTIRLYNNPKKNIKLVVLTWELNSVKETILKIDMHIQKLLRLL